MGVMGVRLVKGRLLVQDVLRPLVKGSLLVRVGWRESEDASSVYILRDRTHKGKRSRPYEIRASGGSVCNDHGMENM